MATVEELILRAEKLEGVAEVCLEEANNCREEAKDIREAEIDAEREVIVSHAGHCYHTSKFCKHVVKSMDIKVMKLKFASRRGVTRCRDCPRF